MKRIIDYALAEVGVREDKGKNNIGKRIQEYQTATWLDPGAWSWCAAFCCWCVREWLKQEEARNLLKLNTKTAEYWRCRDASAFGWEKWAKKKGLRVLPKNDLAKAGDIVIFTFSHIGFVIEDQVKFSEYIHTVEGNTNSAGDRDSHQGDGVLKKYRSNSKVKCYIRMP